MCLKNQTVYVKKDAVICRLLPKAPNHFFVHRSLRRIVSIVLRHFGIRIRGRKKNVHSRISLYKRNCSTMSTATHYTTAEEEISEEGKPRHIFTAEKRHKNTCMSPVLSKYSAAWRRHFQTMSTSRTNFRVGF